MKKAQMSINDLHMKDLFGIIWRERAVLLQQSDSTDLGGSELQNDVLEELGLYELLLWKETQ